jgi:hypothetical protein
MSVVVANGARIPSLGYGTYGMRRNDMLRMIPHVLRAGFLDILPHLKARDSYSARKAALDHLSSHFGGFLLLAISSIAHFTGAPGVSRPSER